MADGMWKRGELEDKHQRGFGGWQKSKRVAGGRMVGSRGRVVWGGMVTWKIQLAGSGAGSGSGGMVGCRKRRGWLLFLPDGTLDGHLFIRGMLWTTMEQRRM